jgi:hypothetical protein
MLSRFETFPLSTTTRNFRLTGVSYAFGGIAQLQRHD